MQLCDLKEERVYSRAQKTATLIGNEPKGERKIYDKDHPVADGLIHDIHNQEYEMAKIISQHPEKSEAYRSKLK